MTQLYRLVYTSRNLIRGSEAELGAEIAQVLATSQRNNARVGVSGALLFNKGAFAQILEGPQGAVEATFERIQRDQRHGDVTVLECAPVDARGFAHWSMAFVGHSSRGQELWSEIAGRSGFDHRRLAADDVFAVLQRLVLDEEGEVEVGPSDPVLVARPGAAPAVPAPPGPDFDHVRAELRHITDAVPAPRGGAGRTGPREVGRPPAVRAVEPQPATGGQAPGDPAPSLAVEVAVLREALASERQRTTALRGELDAAQAVILAGRHRVERLRAERDSWAERVQRAARALLQDVADPMAMGQDAEARAPSAA